ncbi:MAG: acyl-CoA dehydratase activase [Candidatus Woesearchaeota archaeon]
MIVAGVDIGSVTAKAVILKDGKLAGSSVHPTGADCNQAALAVLAEASKQAGVDQKEIKYIMATGYGRRAIDFGNETITEISSNAKGAAYLGSSKGKVHTIIDVGGQDTKAISLDENGNILNFVMNDKCAAGTGRFLEVIARALQEDMESFSKLSLKSTNPVAINSTCTVFAESEVVSLIAQRVKKEDIIAGIHESIAKRIVEMAKAVNVKDVVFFDGGGAKNAGLKQAIETELGFEVFVTQYPQIVVALGAALIAQERVR